jgi:hypothetical protein
VTSPKDDAARLLRIRGGLAPARANARTVAALTENPGCARRRVVDAAAVRAYELAAKLGYPVTRGQSPFAITSGNRFEKRLKEGSEYKLLVEALKPFVPLPEVPRVVDLGSAPGHRIGTPALIARAKMTDEVIAKIARGDEDAPHVVDHPVVVFDLAGTPVYLEPDALALRVGNELQLVEIKSYAIIDGQADPAKVSATGGQAAVYVLALRAVLSRLGFDPDRLRWSVILVAAKNFGRAPTAHEGPLRKKVMALQRVLRAVPQTGDLLTEIPEDFTLDVDPDGKLDDTKRRARLDHALRQLPMQFVPECLASCDLAHVCRAQAICDDEPTRIGRIARDTLAGVPTLADALRLARKGPRADEAEIADIAETLREAWSALERARVAKPVSSKKGAP